MRPGLSRAVLLASPLFLCCVSESHAFAQQASAPSAPVSTADRVQAAARTLRAGRPQAALDQLDAIAKTTPNTPGLARTRGDALYALNRFSEADAAFQAAIARDPSDTESIQMRALTLVRLGKPAQAIPLLLSAHSTSAQSKVDPSYLLALCYLETQQYDDARRAFAAQYSLPADSAAAYLLTARQLLRRELLTQAETFAKHATTLDARLPLAHELLGEIALAENRIDDAISDFRQERAQNPLEPSTYERLGDALSRKGQYAQAEKVLQQAILLEPNATGPYILLGRAYLRQNDPASALPFFEKAEAMDAANPMTHYLLAQTYKVLGRPEDAAREASLTAAAQPHTAGSHK